MELNRNLELKHPLIRGDDVEAVQERLLDLGFDEVGRADSIFGGDTDSGVRQFQRSRNLAIDGIVDRRTWTTLFETAPSGTDGSLDAAAAGDILDGVATQSASMNAIISPEAFCTPRFRSEATLTSYLQSTLAPDSRAISRVRSVEPLSTTITSNCA